MSSSGPYLSIRSTIASRALSSCGGKSVREPSPGSPRARASDAWIARASSREVAISSTSWASADAEPGSVAWASLISTNRSPIDEALVGGVEQVVGGRHDGVGAVDVRLRLRQRSREADEWVVREQVGQVVETPAGDGQVGLESIDGRPVDLETGGLDTAVHRLEVGPERARLVEGGQVAAEGEAGRRGGQNEQTGDHQAAGGSEGDATSAGDVAGAGRPSRAVAAARSVRAATWIRARRRSRPEDRSRCRVRHDDEAWRALSWRGRGLEGQLLGDASAGGTRSRPRGRPAGPGRRRTSASSHRPGSGRSDRRRQRPTATGTIPGRAWA